MLTSDSILAALGTLVHDFLVTYRTISWYGWEYLYLLRTTKPRWKMNLQNTTLFVKLEQERIFIIKYVPKIKPQSICFKSLLSKLGAAFSNVKFWKDLSIASSIFGSSFLKFLLQS